jgi:predicted secreted protein
MGIAGATIVFVLGWWISFFAVLPIGVRGQWEDDSTAPGTEEAAPKNPMLMKKAIWATIGAVVITVVAAVTVPLLLAEGP